MLFSDIIRFYSDSSIKEKMVAFSKNREVIARYGNHVGSRPDVLLYPADIDEMINKGATSFHASLERWTNPLLLNSNITKSEMDNIRCGWDFIADIDCKFLPYSKICADLVCEALEFHSIKNYSLKFSGGSGFHVGIPFESFPQELNKVPITLLFPEGARIIASYLKQMIKNQLSEKILEFENIKQIIKRTGKKFEDIVKDGEFEPYSIIDIDTIAISARHLMRMPYSFNEKKWLVSVPVARKNILDFKEEDAQPKNVVPELDFLSSFKKDEAKQLFIQAFDWNIKEQTKKEIEAIKKEFNLPKEAIDSKFFPPCIINIYKGLKEGRKRALFVLINFLRSSGWEMEAIEKEIIKWNNKNQEPLPESYIKAQLNWHRRLVDNYLPPGCENANYYKDINICTPDKSCENIKNPVVYPLRKIRAQKKIIKFDYQEKY